MAAAHDLGQLVRERSIIICCGSGGAGKTTTSAAIALAGAQAGRKACVVTIDPARRLADALGLGSLENTASRIEGDWTGQLSALMLDAKGTFDDLVDRYSETPEQAQRILANPLYRNLTSALSGTQEYMAAEKLYELHESGDFDLVVVDTPPTRNALDFLDAPGRLTRFLENRVFRLLLMPGRASMKALSVATHAFLRTISRVAGSEIVEDAMAFFRAFEGMEQGFRERATRVEQLLADPGTAFVLVAAPRRDSVSEARFFSARLAEAGLPVAALVMNRVHPDFRAGELGPGVIDISEDEIVPPPSDVEEARALLAALRQNLADLEFVVGEERGYLRLLEGGVEGAVAEVPYLRDDVHDLAGLTLVAEYVVGQVASGRA
ncbi:MAG: ArsA family ATPase [Acidimicrobiales bacterium]|jgi:anion-transporting  ArsA/GET3 family ATPase